MTTVAPRILLSLAAFSAIAEAAAPARLDPAIGILEQHCAKCHSHASGKSKGGLLLDSREALLAGGDTGPAIVPGKPEESLLIKAVQYHDEDLQMPPKGEKLKEAEIAALVAWVKADAPWPQAKEVAGEAAGVKRRTPGKFSEEDRQWWAFQPIRSPEPPVVKKAAAIRNPVDQFIQARLETEGLAPAPEASRQALIRRVSFDLTGLPPTPEEVAAFTADAAPDAYEKLVDRLLASPRYGERMARYWLDLVRYADGDGYRADDYRPHAWRYRDYVIRSLNSDKPYDRFVREQLAGDELYPDDPDALVATGYLRHGIYEWNARDVRGQWDTILNDLTDTTGDVFLGLGVQCARCHDHKFDPILQKDYYRLRAFFAPIQPGDRPAASQAEIAAHAEKIKVWEEKTAALRAELAQLEQPYLDKAEKIAVERFPDDIQAMIRKPADQREPLEAQLAALAWRQVIYDWERVDRSFKGADKEKILSLRRQLAELSKDKPAPLPIAFAAADVGPKAPPVTIPKRSNLGDIEPGFLTILDPAPAKVAPLPNSTGRRTALVNWLFAPENPLTARVVANRAWQQFFGKGLAANASDFGMLGEKPTHPELLDWLAHRFAADGWSMKKLHRLIVTSATYRQGGENPVAAQGKLKDPENRLLWRFVPRRLEAEQIRDAMLAVSGELLPTEGGPGATPDVAQRTIYTRFMRNTRDALADVFDAPQWFTSTSSRDTTTTPVQSLFLANSAPMRTRGRAFAERLEKAHPGNMAAQVQLAYQLAYGRAPQAAELKAAQQFLQKQTALADKQRLASGQAVFIPGKVPYRDGQGAYIEPEGSQTMFRVNESASMPIDGAFTIEAFIVPRTVAETGSLRTIAAKWSGDVKSGGWTLGITGQKSRRKPLTLALQMVGQHQDGQVREHPVFSDLSLQMNKPYFVAAAFTPASATEPGNVFFALKDLSNDDEPLLTAVVQHDIVGGLANQEPVTIGARSGKDRQSFHGLIDDVRLSRAALPAARMLFTSESIAETTLGYWKFEALPDVFSDSSNHGRTLERPATPTVAQNLNASQAALADFCHALLNSSEFLYIE
jgi:mono/diheme cytochrome c family protein